MWRFFKWTTRGVGCSLLMRHNRRHHLFHSCFRTWCKCGAGCTESTLTRKNKNRDTFNSSIDHILNHWIHSNMSQVSFCCVTSQTMEKKVRLIVYYGSLCTGHSDCKCCLRRQCQPKWEVDRQRGTRRSVRGLHEQRRASGLQSHQGLLHLEELWPRHLLPGFGTSLSFPLFGTPADFPGGSFPNCC